MLRAVGGDLHQPALGAHILEKEDELELEENHRVDAGAARRNGVAVLDQLPDERDVEGALQATVEIILREEFFEREIFERGEVALLNSHHDGATSRGDEVERSDISETPVVTPTSGRTEATFSTRWTHFWYTNLGHTTGTLASGVSRTK